MGRKERQRVRDDDPYGIERHEPERDLAVRKRLRRLRGARNETDERAGLGGDDIGLDPLVHRRPEPFVPAAIPDFQAQPVAVITEPTVLLAQLSVIRRRFTEQAAAVDPAKGPDESLVIQDGGRPEQRGALLAGDCEEPLRKPMRLVTVIQDRLIERAT